MNEKILISVIIRVKNEECFIQRCLESVFKQKIDVPYEVIAVFDKTSTDGTLDILKKYAVDIVYLQDFIPRYTMPKAMNIGIKHAQGDIIVMLSGDAVAKSEDWLRCLTEPFKDTNVAAVGGRMVPRKECYPMERRRIESAFPIEERDNWILPFAGCAVRKSILEKYPLREDLLCGEDKDLKLKLISDGYRIPYKPKAAVEHSHNMSLKRHFLIGQKRGQAYNMLGLLPPKLNSKSNMMGFIALSFPRLMKNLIKKITADYVDIYKNKDSIKWYFWSWPYEISYLIGHYTGPIYYKYKKYEST